MVFLFLRSISHPHFLVGFNFDLVTAFAFFILRIVFFVGTIDLELISEYLGCHSFVLIKPEAFKDRIGETAQLSHFH